MRVVTTGSRKWTDYDRIRSRLAELPMSATILTGTAPGADAMCERAARDIGLRVERWPANWELEGRGAGFTRNIRMLESGCDLVIAFWDGSSHGTRHTIDEARARGLAVEVIQL